MLKGPTQSAFSGPADFGLGVMARCERTGAVGAAIANSTVAAGSRCLFIDGQVAVVLVMAFTNPHLGPLTLKLLGDTLKTDEIFALLRRHDRHFAYRQVGILPLADAPGAFSGDRTPQSSAMRVGDHAVCLGNGLPDASPLDAAMAAIEKSSEPLEQRLVAGLSAGRNRLQKGAEVRSASLMVGHGAALPRTDLRVDLVDDQSAGDAVDRLTRTVDAWVPLIPYYRALPDDPDIGSWRDWTPAVSVHGR